MKPMIDWLSVKMVKPCVLHSSCNVLPYILSCLPETILLLSTWLRWKAVLHRIATVGRSVARPRVYGSELAHSLFSSKSFVVASFGCCCHSDSRLQANEHRLKT